MTAWWYRHTVAIMVTVGLLVILAGAVSNLLWADNSAQPDVEYTVVHVDGGVDIEKRTETATTITRELVTW